MLYKSRMWQWDMGTLPMTGLFTSAWMGTSQSLVMKRICLHLHIRGNLWSQHVFSTAHRVLYYFFLTHPPPPPPPPPILHPHPHPLDKMTAIMADDNFTFLNENNCIPNQISRNFVPKSPIDYTPALVQIMACRLTGDTPLSEPMRNQFSGAYMRH